jgi:hypothetical protein
MNDKPPSLKDFLGIEPVSHAIDKSVEGVGKFLGRIINPSADQIGLLFADQIEWIRTKNAISISTKTEKLLGEQDSGVIKHVPARIAMKILQEGSWIDNEEVQDMWAGLLAASCSESGTDDSNLIFINLLSQLTSLEATIINFICEKSAREIASRRELVSIPYPIAPGTLERITGVNDPYRFGRELAHLQSLGLIYGNGQDYNPDYHILMAAKQLTLQMYARCHGFSGDPVLFFVSIAPQEPYEAK